MPHVVTQSCVGDGSCVYACPVNCIQPTPDDPAFELAEMLHVDPTTCVDCGACTTACPVDAIKPHTRLTEEERAFEVINASYHAQARGPRAKMAPVRPVLEVRDRGEALRVAIVGSGPAAMYAAEEVLTVPGAQVSVYERMPTPYGLVRTGVAPDHRRTRRVSRQLDAVRRHPGLTMHLGVEIGRDVTHEALLRTHHAVIYAVGAAVDRRLDIPGADLPGAMTATQIVGWYTGHPDHAERAVDLSARRAVVIGNGNVALDIARILTMDPEALVDSEVAPAALRALRASRIEEVVVVARRGPERSAFTLPELVGLRGTPGVALHVLPEDLAGAPDGDPKIELLRDLAPDASGRRVTLRYGLTPVAVRGDAGSVSAVNFDRTGGGGTETIDAGLLVTSIGYRGTPLGQLPFDDARGVVPNEDGRVVDPATGAAVPGTYVAGWIKRGPSGFIGTNRGCSQDTVAALVADYNAGRLVPPPDAPRGAGPGRGAAGTRPRGLLRVARGR
ncbi:4Fe-4S dicluster domain-containing protein [Conexibacter sp. W3-3-2]|uniref:FAD-dependent oxidoreductase n=1 Tax=Conexibacter sp. W3-3-2 TaxID=2675227 RepID=UPI0013284525|nr:FAD-dependent oxidoreductase [Conexibacter sp. W3-3-2]MTD46506.1 4Fe-4S dicluster domain-containing protein [Conexibacter sp. W3-3-2]